MANHHFTSIFFGNMFKTKWKCSGCGMKVYAYADAVALQGMRCR